MAWRPYNVLEFVPRESTDRRRLWPTTHSLSLSLSRGTWPILGRIDYHPNREIFTDASIDSFFSFLPSPIVSFKRSRVVSKWLMGCPSSEVFHRFVSRENDENSKEMERESRVRFARDISRYLWIVLIIVLITKNSSKYACQRSNFFWLFFFWIYIVKV